MIGLLLKDFYSLRSFLLKQLSLLFIVYICVGIAMKSMAFLAPMLLMSVLISVISSFSIDESSQFYSFALTLPLSSRDIVGARYLLFFGVVLGGGVVSGLICTLIDMVTFHQGAAAIWGSVLAIMLMYAPICCICLPLFFKLGAEKGRIWMMFSFMVPFFLVIGGASWLKESAIPMPTEAQIAQWIWVLLAAGIVCVALFIFISYRICVKLFESKEF